MKEYDDFILVNDSDYDVPKILDVVVNTPPKSRIIEFREPSPTPTFLPIYRTLTTESIQASVEREPKPHHHNHRAKKRYKRK